MRPATRERVLVLPVENQVRELDAKILLAYVAAARGFTVYLGSRTEVDFAVARLSGGRAGGVYLSKSLTARSRKMFRILNLLGFRVAAWDEEAVVHYPPDIYYARRMDADSLALVHHLLAWGEDNAELFRAFPGYPGTPIHVTGNPRGDLLRPELRAFHESQARRLRGELGDFVLVNTNFGGVNAFYPHLNFLRPAAAGETPAFGTAAVGMTREFAEGKAAHKTAVFESLQKLVPALADAFPGIAVVVRPHPSERRDVYEALAERHERVIVRHEGGVVPWLLASRALLHNGCTTAVEAYALGVPALAWRPVTSERFDDRLPNDLSLECRDEAQLFQRLREVLDGEVCGPASPERDALLDRFLTARSGALASERIVDVLEAIDDEGARLPRPPLRRRLEGRVRATRRRIVKGGIKARLPGQKNNPAFQRHRYPGMAPAEVEQRLARFGEILGRPERPAATLVAPHVHRIALARSGTDRDQ